MVRPSSLWKSSVIFHEHDCHVREVLSPLVASRLRVWTAVLPKSSLSRPARGIFTESCRHQSGISWAAYPHSQPVLHTDLITPFALLFIHMLAGFIFAWTPSPNNALFFTNRVTVQHVQEVGNCAVLIQGKKERIKKLGKWDGRTEQRKVATIRKWERARGGL